MTLVKICIPFPQRNNCTLIFAFCLIWLKLVRVQSKESVLTCRHLHHMFCLPNITSEFQDHCVLKSSSCAPARSRKRPLRGIKPTSGATSTGHSERSPACASSCLLYSAHPCRRARCSTPHLYRWKGGEIEHPEKLGVSKDIKSVQLFHSCGESFFGLFEGVLQSSQMSFKVHIPVNGAVRVRGTCLALVSVVMVAGWSVSSPCFTSVCLHAAPAVCSLSCFSRLFHLTRFSAFLCLYHSHPHAASPSPPSPSSHPSSSAPRLFCCVLSSCFWFCYVLYLAECDGGCSLAVQV